MIKMVRLRYTRTRLVGTAKGVVVKRLDIYGNVTAIYTPTVIGQTRVENAHQKVSKVKRRLVSRFLMEIDLSVAPTLKTVLLKKLFLEKGPTLFHLMVL